MGAPIVPGWLLLWQLAPVGIRGGVGGGIDGPATQIAESSASAIGMVFRISVLRLLIQGIILVISTPAYYLSKRDPMGRFSFPVVVHGADAGL